MAAIGDTTIVSTNAQGALSDCGNSGPSVSDDGRYVAFSTCATNMTIPNETEISTDVFVKDRQTGAVRRVGSEGGGSAISGNGRYVAFVSSSTTLVPGYTDSNPDVYRWDAQTGTIIQVSVGPGAEDDNGYTSGRLSISDDGNRIAFRSRATNLVTSRTTTLWRIYVRDVQANTTTEVSTGLSGADANNGSASPEISGDGNVVAFMSEASNLVANDINGFEDVFVRDLGTNATRLVSVSSTGVPANAGIPGYDYDDSLGLSDDGRYIVFPSLASTLVPGDGRTYVDVFLRDTVANTTTMISVSSSGSPGSNAEMTGLPYTQRPSISDDGRFAVFETDKTGLVPNDAPTARDVFLRDLQTGKTTLMSVSSASVPGDKNSFEPVISGNGQIVVFTSNATNLTALHPDELDSPGIYAHELDAPPATTPTRTPTITPTPPEAPPIVVTSQYGSFFFITPNLPEAAYHNSYAVELTRPVAAGSELLVSFNGQQRVIPFSGQRTSFELDVREAQPGLNHVTVMVRSAGSTSPPTPVEFTIVSAWPTWISRAATGPTTGQVGQWEVAYGITGRFPNNNGPCKTFTNVPDFIPLIGGQYGMPNPNAELKVEATSRGNVKGEFKGKLCFSYASGANTFEGFGTVKGTLKGHFDANEIIAYDSGALELGFGGSYERSSTLCKLFAPICEKLLKNEVIGKRLEAFDGATKLSAKITVTIYATNIKIIRDINGDLDFEAANPKIKVAIELASKTKLSENVKFTASFGGEAAATLQLPADPDLLEKFEGKVYGKLSLRAWGFSFDTEVAYKDCYGSKSSCPPSLASAAATTYDAGWRWAPRTYVTNSYAEFAGARPPTRDISRSNASLAKQTLVSNAYPDAEPGLVVWGDAPAQHALLVWSHDDTTKPLGLGTDLVYSLFDGTSWGTPQHITNDLVPDMHPQVVNDGRGHLVAVWTRIPGASEQDTLNTAFSRKIELAYATYTLATGTWSAPRLLTQNNALDYSPGLVASNDGAIIVSWLRNDVGTLTSAPSTPSALQAAFWDGSAWGEPQVIAEQVDSAVAAVGSTQRGAVLFSRDDDGDIATLADRHLFQRLWNGSAWSAVTQLATGASFYGLQALYPRDATPLFIWNEGGELVSEYGATRTTLVASDAAGLGDARLVADRQGNTILLYQAPSAAGVDLYGIAYNARLHRWGRRNS
jgi:hypothetical protein